uniref:Zinc finger BED domain-containing protein RICESLEEPER 2-like n=1 Tax=Tanacetum cinerariifolium TaxID=118510 RepID=A0A699HR29_TANCI|nr:zinc finger BED domain-containing protein RICESLEEPER 2-like [Tanacetum cinerariifolium]
MSDNTKKAQCIHCLHFFSKDSNSTLKNHISHPHCEALKMAAEPGQSSMSRDVSLFVYNPDVLREQLAGLVIQRGLPFNHFDDEQTTRVFQKHLQPKYNHVSRTTLKRDAMKLWVAAKQVIIDDFLKLNTNVNLTTDIWSAPHGVPGSYICVAAHWIEPVTWKMMTRVIAFEYFPAPHSGSALAKTLRNVFVNFNLENKIMSITLDNASNNTLAIGKLKLKYDPPTEGRFYHSRCVAHIINLCVQDGLAVPTINNIKESFKTMLKDVFRSGGKNHQRYVRICKQAEKPSLTPHWDVPTRWNSIYHMFLSGLKQKSNLMYFHDLWASKGRCVHFPTENWVIIESLTQLLEVFNNATKFLSGVYYPTSPLVLQQIFFMTTKLSEYELEGAALNPCFNVQGVEFLIESISTDLDFFDDIYATKAKKWFTDSFEGFYNIYYTKYGNPTTTESSIGGGGSSSRASHENQVTSLLRRLKEYTNKKARSDPSLQRKQCFPLSRTAMDILSVQATSVASESVFSTSGRVLSIRRTRLTPASLEMYFEEKIMDAKVQANEAIPLSDEEITLDVASSECSMSGPGLRGKEVEANYGYDVYHDDY